MGWDVCDPAPAALHKDRVLFLFVALKWGDLGDGGSKISCQRSIIKEECKVHLCCISAEVVCPSKTMDMLFSASVECLKVITENSWKLCLNASNFSDMCPVVLGVPPGFSPEQLRCAVWVSANSPRLLIFHHPRVILLWSIPAKKYNRTTVTHVWSPAHTPSERKAASFSYVTPSGSQIRVFFSIHSPPNASHPPFH